MIPANYIFKQRNISELASSNIIEYIIDPSQNETLNVSRESQERVTVFINSNMEMFSRVNGHRYTINRNICETYSKFCFKVLYKFFKNVHIDCDKYRNGTENAIYVPARHEAIIMNPITYCKFTSPKRLWWMILPRKPLVFECNTLDCNYILDEIPQVC